MTAAEILEACEHNRHRDAWECCGGCDSPCRSCADRAIAQARVEALEEAKQAVDSIRIKYDADMISVQSIHKGMAAAEAADAIRALMPKREEGK